MNPSRDEKTDETFLNAEKLPFSKSELASFNFTISHEIKVPMRAIDGYIRIFLEDYGNQIDGEGAAMLHNVRSICKETIEMADKLLQYSSLLHEQPSNEIVNMQELIRETFERLRYSGGGTGTVSLVFETAVPAVLGDSLLLKQAVTNILSNALKFTRNKEEGRITVGFGPEGESRAFYFRDNGAGFDMQFVGKLFGVFERIHSAEEFEGTGIGLAIVKRVVALHGGRVWITGSVGQGAAVFIAFPDERILPASV